MKSTLTTQKIIMRREREIRNNQITLDKYQATVECLKTIISEKKQDLGNFKKTLEIK